mgnify:CR=1 FL=1
MRTLCLALLLVACNLDPDEDGLNRREEKAAGTDPKVDDSDGDGLVDGDEAERGTDPTQADTDGDGVDDGDEVAAQTDPLDTDSDDDGLSDGEESALGTDPLDVDSDDDRIGDADEVAGGTDPIDADTDDDGVNDGDELDRGLDPLDVDTDDDFLGDGDELTEGTDPLEPDSDFDGYLDGDEVIEGSDPTDALSRIYEGGWPYRRDKDSLTDPGEGAALTVGERLPDALLPDLYGDAVALYDLGGWGTSVVLHIGPDDAASDALTALRTEGAEGWEAIDGRIDAGDLIWARVITGEAPNLEALNRWYATHPDRDIVVLGDEAQVLSTWAAAEERPTLVLCDQDLVVVAIGEAGVIGGI